MVPVPLWVCLIITQMLFSNAIFFKFVITLFLVFLSKLVRSESTITISPCIRALQIDSLSFYPPENV